MSTPAMALGTAVRNLFFCAWFMWMTTFSVSRMYLLHEAYIEETNRRSDEQWLLKQCNNPEFYSNIRQHTDICTEVAKNAKSSLLLKALYKVASSTHICGRESCMETLYGLILRFGWQATLLAALIMVVAPNFVLGILHYLQQQRAMRKKEEAMMANCFAEKPMKAGNVVDLQALQASNAQMMLLRNRKVFQQQHPCDRTIKIL
jgi:hypothetical protein